MKNSGFVAVGHVLATKVQKDYVKTLRYFTSVMFCNMDEKFVHKEIGFWLFDKFMEATEASVSSFATLLNGILKKHEDSEYDELDFQRKVRVRVLST